MNDKRFHIYIMLIYVSKFKIINCADIFITNLRQNLKATIANAVVKLRSVNRTLVKKKIHLFLEIVAFISRIYKSHLSLARFLQNPGKKPKVLGKNLIFFFIEY